LVLGSQQPESDVDVNLAASLGLDVCRRRSGGGLVAVMPNSSLWIDVLIGPGDPRWTDDVDHAAIWLGSVWIDALVQVGVDRSELSQHHGPIIDRVASRTICFAGNGPGEVLRNGVKLVGISQRRGRWGARLQCQVHFGDERKYWTPVIRSAAVDLDQFGFACVSAAQAARLPRVLSEHLTA